MRSYGPPKSSTSSKWNELFLASWGQKPAMDPEWLTNDGLAAWARLVAVLELLTRVLDRERTPMTLGLDGFSRTRSVSGLY